MRQETVQLNAVGITIRLTIKDEETRAVLALGAASVKQIILKSPRSERAVKNASFTTNGSDGQLEYLTQDGDLNRAGQWQAQAYIEMGGIKTFSTIVPFTVVKNL